MRSFAFKTNRMMSSMTYSGFDMNLTQFQILKLNLVGQIIHTTMRFDEEKTMFRNLFFWPYWTENHC